MIDRQHERYLKPVTGTVYGLAAAGAVALVVGVVATGSRPAVALQAYAQQTHLACGRCHVNPAGGGALNAFGNSFAANGHKLASAAKPAKPGTANVGVVAPVSQGASSGGYYSSINNPRYGYVPELGYSNSLFFGVYPRSGD